MHPLDDEIKRLLIEALQLDDVTPESIDPLAPLFGEGLGLDSVDALEIVMQLKRRYGIQLSSNSQETRKHFASVRTLAELVAAHRAQAAGA
jgi:acyl carrier protein